MASRFRHDYSRRFLTFLRTINTSFGTVIIMVVIIPFV